MKIEINLPSELIDLIADRVIEKLKPLLPVKEEKEKDEIFNVRSLAYYLKVSTKWINELLCSNEIPYVRIKGQIRFKKSEIDKWYEKYNIPSVRRLHKTKEKGIEK